LSITTDTPVLIVGAGPTGLSAALLLADHGVASVVVEKERVRRDHPKARGVRLRTMEIFRQLGLESELRSHALPPEAMRFIYCDSLAGDEIARTAPLEGVDQLSPTSACRVPQDTVESALLEHAEAEPLITLRLGVEFAELEQGDERVVTTLAGEAGRRETLNAQYVIAADGVASSVRSQLGIELEGEPLLGYWQSIYWQGDISDLVAGRLCIQFFTGARTGSFSTVASVDGKSRWVTIMMRPAGETKPEPPTIAESEEIVRQAVGDLTLQPTILDIATWRISAQVANRYRVGRVFLAGDAAHSMPPTGGFGMNTGVQDAHNLAWKLAYVLDGRASPSLLDTYEQERRPIAIDNCEWSVSNSRRMVEIRSAIAENDKSRLTAALREQVLHVGALGQDLGFWYSSDAVTSDAASEPEKSPGEYQPTARAGHRAPHVWLNSERGRRSSLDLFHDSFVLLVGPDGEGWAERAWLVSCEFGVPLKIVQLGAQYIEEDPGSFARVFDVTSGGAVLVRPDGHVAWRGRGTDETEASRLDVAVCRALNPSLAATFK
jgi:putative polyketide hydroxylase